MHPIHVYKITELATLEGVTVRTIHRNKAEYIPVLIPFGKKGRILKRYLDKETSLALIQRKNEKA